MKRFLDHKLLLAYFKPKAFERSREDSIYRWIGIKFFKKYLPTSGDIARKIKGITQIEHHQADRFLEIRKYEHKTRIFEFRHMLGMIVFIFILLLFEKNYSLFDYLLVSILFLILNIYPILLQRHNRIRILNLLKRQGQSSLYD
ncbi:MAG: hypothetical protein AAGD28_25775 [Bacteroidota bacterium]